MLFGEKKITDFSMKMEEKRNSHAAMITRT
jgi:hypothetical protein